MSSTFQHPQSFKAFQFMQEDASTLEMQQVQWKDPQHGQVAIRVHAVGLNATDNIARYNLIDNVHYPTTPGTNVVGEIVQCGPGVKHLKQGQHVAAILSHKGLAEYCIADEHFTCVLSKKQISMEEVVVEAYNGARIESSIRRREKELEMEDEKHCQEINKRMGFEGSGVCVAYGEGGCAKMAIDILRNYHSSRLMSKDTKVILVTTSEQWKAEDYGIQPQDLLCASKHDIAKELKSRGGAKFIIATDQPQQGFENLLDGMRYRSELVVLSPFRDQLVQLPLGNVIAKDLSIRAPSWADSKSIEKALDLFDKNKLKVGTNKFMFDQAQVNEAWQQMDSRSKFDAPIVLVHSHQQNC